MANDNKSGADRRTKVAEKRIRGPQTVGYGDFGIRLIPMPAQPLDGGVGLDAGPGGGIEQPGDLVAAQHDRQLAGTTRRHQPTGAIEPIERMGEEEPRRRHDAVHGRHRYTGPALLDLELAQILRRRRIGGRPRKVAKRPTSRT
jgi:hypothetical protein